MLRRVLSIACLCAMSLAAATRGEAEDAFALAVKLYTEKRYAESETLFLKALAAAPNNADAHYYLASCYQYQRRFDQAKKEFALVVEKFPGTRAAQYASEALAAYRVAPTKDAAEPSGTAASGTLSSGNLSSGNIGDNIPDEDWVSYSRDTSGHIHVRPTINGSTQDMVFDTGAEMNVMSTKQWRAMGQDVPTGPYQAYGAGVSGSVGIWAREVVIELGKIRKRTNLCVMDSPDIPGLLGETFFGDMEYDIDSSAGYIHFFKKGHATGENAIPYDSIDIPFQRDGNNMLVQAKVNGRPIDCVFDTGASSCMFGINHLAQLGLQIPSDAKVDRVFGVGGTSMSYAFRVNTIEIGDLRKSDMEILVTGTPQSVPLIGQTFFGDRKYVIDNQRMLIRFVR